MALRSLVVLWCVTAAAAGFPELQRAAVDHLPAAFQGIMGNQSSLGVMGLETAQSLLKRQASCPVGENNCGYIGECCAVDGGDNCCGTMCIASRPKGTKCCSSYLCAAGWDCCGDASGCSPEGGDCCNSDGQYCPKDWSCCGKKGFCAPNKDSKCCGDDGTYCPQSDTCVICKGSDSKVCCQGPDNSQVPVFQTKALSENESIKPMTDKETSSHSGTASASTSAGGSASSSSSSSAAAAASTTSGSAASTSRSSTTTTAAGGTSTATFMKFNSNFAFALGLVSMALLF